VYMHRYLLPVYAYICMLCSDLSTRLQITYLFGMVVFSVCVCVCVFSKPKLPERASGANGTTTDVTISAACAQKFEGTAVGRSALAGTGAADLVKTMLSTVGLVKRLVFFNMFVGPSGPWHGLFQICWLPRVNMLVKHSGSPLAKSFVETIVLRRQNANNIVFLAVL
jgi:hypothetical protein